MTASSPATGLTHLFIAALAELLLQDSELVYLGKQNSLRVEATIRCAAHNYASTKGMILSLAFVFSDL
jgi:hypothetical protein